MISNGGAGSSTPSLLASPFEVAKSRAYEYGTRLFWEFASGIPDAIPLSDACLVVGNAWISEGYDQLSIRDDYTGGLTQQVASKCNNTIVVFHNAGTCLVSQ